MNANTEDGDLRGRLNLIETMIAEGRRTTESFGWAFVLWGVAYYVAIAWSLWGKSYIGWPVTMIAASILTGIFASRSANKRPETTIGRAMMAIWVGMGISTFLLMMSLGISGRLEPQSVVAIVAAMIGAANATSSIILKWRMQFACAVVWWTSAVASCFISEAHAGIVFLIALFFCQIAFGIYGMVAESHKRKGSGASQGASHA